MKIIATIQDGKKYLAEVSEYEIRLLSGGTIKSYPRIGIEIKVHEVYLKTTSLVSQAEEAKKVANNFRALADLLDTFAPSVQALVQQPNTDETEGEQ